MPDIAQGSPLASGLVLQVDELDEDEEYVAEWRGRIWSDGAQVHEYLGETGPEVLQELLGYVVQRAGYTNLRGAVDTLLRRFEP